MDTTGKRSRLAEAVFFLVLSIVSLVLTLTVHKKEYRFTWQSEIWSDRAGYYIYLPATILYHFDFAKCPQDLDARAGYGFVLNKKLHKIFTQYYYGEALMLSPFFIGTHWASKLLGIDEEAGFSPLYHTVMNIGAVFYLLLGLWFLKKFLERHFKPGIQYLLLLILLFGTNLLYYGVEDTLMSHVFSFCGFSVFLFAMQEFLADPSRYRYFLLLSFAFALMLMIRPTNLVAGTVYLFWNIRKPGEILERLKIFRSPKHLFVFLGILLPVVIPQMLYWKYAYGSYFITSYGNTGFSNWNSPHLVEVWFSTLNGLFIYNPVILLFLAGMIYMIVKKIPNGILVLCLFLVVSYIAGSWKYWYFGCSYGHRAFVEFLPILCFPMGILLVSVFSVRNIFIRSSIFLLIFSLTYFNLKLSLERMYTDKCFYGSVWDWEEFKRSLDKADIYSSTQRLVTFTNDFENGEQVKDQYQQYRLAHSGLFSVRISSDRVYACEFKKPFWDLKGSIPEKADASIWIYKKHNYPTGALLVCSIELNGKSVAWESRKIDRVLTRPGEWVKVDRTITIPEGIDREAILSVYIWNPKRTVFYADDMVIKFE
jgi:hypothetical protein